MKFEEFRFGQTVFFARPTGNRSEPYVMATLKVGVKTLGKVRLDEEGKEALWYNAENFAKGRYPYALTEDEAWRHALESCDIVTKNSPHLAERMTDEKAFIRGRMAVAA